MKKHKTNINWGTTADHLKQLGEAATQSCLSMMDMRTACAILGGAEYIYDTIYIDTRNQTTALQMYPYVLKGWKLTQIYSFDCYFTRCDFKLKLND